MGFEVTKFKSNLSAGGGGARPSLFQIDINGPTSTLSFSGSSNLLVKAAAIPASNIAPLTVNYRGRAYKTPGFRTFDTWSVTVMNDEDMAARGQLLSWMQYIGGAFRGSRSELFGGAAEEASRSEGDATITQLGVDGKAKQSWKVHQMWPTELGEIPLDWSNDAIEEYTVTWAYDYWSHGTGASTNNQVSLHAPNFGT